MNASTRQRLLELVQGSDEWHAERRGCVTASIAERLLSVTERGLPGLIRLIQSGGPDISHKPAVARGKREEDWGRFAWEQRHGMMVQTVGLLVHPCYDLVRCSPDGLVGDDGGLEVKCPTRREEHLQALARILPAIHVAQVQFSLWVSEREWWDLVSWKPDEPEGKKFACVRALPDRRMFQKFDARVQYVLPYLEAA